MIRGDADAEFRRLRERFPDPNRLTLTEQHQFHEAYAQYKRNTDYRRAFICEPCYKALDVYLGIGVIDVNGVEKRFNLASSCRFDRAARYDFKKWHSYQKRTAHLMGLSMEA